MYPTKISPSNRSSRAGAAAVRACRSAAEAQYMIISCSTPSTALSLPVVVIRIVERRVIDEADPVREHHKATKCWCLTKAYNRGGYCMGGRTGLPLPPTQQPFLRVENMHAGGRHEDGRDMFVMSRQVRQVRARHKKSISRERELEHRNLQRLSQDSSSIGPPVCDS